MKRQILISTMCLMTLSAISQSSSVVKPNYELADRFSPDKVGRMVFSQNVDPHYLKTSNKFWYSYKTPKGTFWYIVDVDKKKKELLFDNTDMASQITKIVKDPFDTEHLPITSIRFSDKEDSFMFKVTSSEKHEVENEITGKKETKNKEFFLQYNLADKKITHLKDYKEEKSFPSWASPAPDTSVVVFARNFNLYYMDKENFKKAIKNDKDSTIVEHQITSDGEEFYEYGGSTNNSTNVSKIKDADNRKSAYVVWSPDSKHFAMVRVDQRNLGDMWVINSVAEPRPTLETYKYHLPGESNAPMSYLYVFNKQDMTSKKVETYAFKDQTIGINYARRKPSTRDNRFSPAVWLGDNDKFYLTRTSRDLKRIDLCVVNLDVDSARCIVEDRLNKSLETRSPYLLEKTKELIHWSECDGWGHLYLYGDNGVLKNQITKGDFHCDAVIGADEKQRILYFKANGVDKNENPYYSHLYSIKFDGSDMKRLTEANFNNVFATNDDNSLFVANYSRVDTNPTSALYDNRGKKLLDLEKTDLTQLFAAGYKFPETFTTKADDGVTDLYGVMYKPFDFDSTKKYPIICYVYPGPQTEAVNTSFSLGMDRVDRLAQFGFIVITVGNRGGNPARSKWYHTYGYGNLRDYGLADKKTTVQQLAAKYDFIDASRVGIHGHSGGGFMSTAAVLMYPDFFKVAVSSAGNHENNIYNRWWSEKHHGVEEVVSEKGDTTFNYDIAKNTQVAYNLKGHLMLVTGDMDNNVHPANTLRMVNALIKYNKRFDMLMLPTQRHGFGDMTEYFFWKMGDYFCEHLLGSKQTDVNIPQMSR